MQYLILPLVCLCAATNVYSQKCLLVGQKYIRANDDYSVTVCALQQHNVNAKFTLLGRIDDNVKVLNMSKSLVASKGTCQVATFEIASILPGQYALQIVGLDDIVQTEQIDLLYDSNSLVMLIQTSKPIYKPGETLQLRVVVLDSDLKPLKALLSISVVLRDSKNILIRSWPYGQLSHGIFESEFTLGATPNVGLWKITASTADQDAIKNFEVSEYVVPTFKVDIATVKLPLLEDKKLSLAISVTYTFGTPVNGRAIVEFQQNIDAQTMVNKFPISGTRTTEFSLAEVTNMFAEFQMARVTTTVFENFTNRTVTRTENIKIYKSPYRVVLRSSQHTFKPGVSHRYGVEVKHHDGTAVNTGIVTFTIDFSGTEFERSVLKNGTITSGGFVNLNIDAPVEADIFILRALYQGVTYELGIFESDDTLSKVFLRISNERPATPGESLQMRLECSEALNYFVYFVLCKGKIVHTQLQRLANQKLFQWHIPVSVSMMPKSTILAATVVNGYIYFDHIDIVFTSLQHQLQFRMNADVYRPGDKLQLSIKGRPHAYVALGAIDEGVLQLRQGHDITVSQILKDLAKFSRIDSMAIDPIHALGFFSRTDAKMDEVTALSSRIGASHKDQSSLSTSVRSKFVESFLWQNALLSNEGAAIVTDVIPDSTTSWLLNGYAISERYGLEIIEQPIRFTSVKPFFVVANLPYSIKRGEVVALQFTVFNFLQTDVVASVKMILQQNETQFIEKHSTAEQLSKEVKVSQRSGSAVSFLIRANKMGEVVIRLQAKCRQETDTVVHVLRVTAESLEQRKSSNRFFSHSQYDHSNYTLNIDINYSADEGSEKIKFVLDPDLFGDAIKNLDRLLDKPTGCGEQNMVRFVPNVVVLDYLSSVGSNTPEIVTKAKGLLRAGYQNQLQYRLRDNSFGIWKSSKGGVFLTAFVAMSMSTASKYIDIDINMVEKAFAWLARKQHSTGRFDETGDVYHKDMQGSLRQGISLTSYIVIAFLENPKVANTHKAVIEKSVQYVANSLNRINDSYDLAIATYALMLYGHPLRNNFYNQLIESSKTVAGNKRYWPRSSSQIETTAYALLAFIQHEKYLEATSIMRWLNEQKYHTGSFPGTQDTFVGLKALTKLAQHIGHHRNDYKVLLEYANGKKQTTTVSSKNKFETYIVDLPGDTRELNVSITGIGFGYLQLTWSYYLQLNNFKNQFELSVTKISPTPEILKLRVCTSYIPKLLNTVSNMVIVEVFFPSGYVADSDTISDATPRRSVKKTEYRYGKTAVVLYYNGMGTEENCFTATAYRRHQVALIRPAAIIVSDYYQPEFNAIHMYEADSSQLCDICVDETCSKLLC